MKSVKRNWLWIAVAIVALAGLFVFFKPASATVVDACNQQFTYEKSSDYNDGRVTIDFSNTGASGNPDSISVSADAGYEIVSVQLDVENDNQGGYVTYTGNFPGTFNPSGETINKVKVVVKKVCTEVCGDPEATNYQAPVAGQTTANNQLCEYPTPVVDVCTNLEGTQETVPEGYTEDEGTCTEIPDESTGGSDNETPEDKPKSGGGGDIAGGSICGGNPNLTHTWVWTDEANHRGGWECLPNGGTGGSTGSTGITTVPLNVLPYTGDEPMAFVWTLIAASVAFLSVLVGGIAIAGSKK